MVELTNVTWTYLAHICQENNGKVVVIVNDSTGRYKVTIEKCSAR